MYVASGHVLPNRHSVWIPWQDLLRIDFAGEMMPAERSVDVLSLRKSWTRDSYISDACTLAGSPALKTLPEVPEVFGRLAFFSSPCLRRQGLVSALGFVRV